MKIRYGIPYWPDRFPASRRPAFLRHHGHLRVSVAIVGGGLSGCAIAYAFAAAGIEVALFEAARVGDGATAHSLGLLTRDPAVEFRTLRELHGLRAARHVWETSRRAALDFAATLRRLRIQCDLDAPGALLCAPGRDDLKRLRQDQQARREAGLEAPWLNAVAVRRAAGIDAAGAIRSPESGHLDPYRACLGLARAAAARGARLFERTAVRRVRGGRRAVEIRTDGGTVRSEVVVIATGAPTRELYKPLLRHFDARERYAVLTPPLPAAVRRAAGSGRPILQDTATPPHTLRWTKDERILFAGADHPPTLVRQRPKVLVQRGGQLMYELSLLYPVISGIQPEHVWNVPLSVTRDGIPYLGPHRNYGRHLFALGFGANGVGFAHLAARVLLRHYLGEPARGDEILGFVRTLG